MATTHLKTFATEINDSNVEVKRVGFFVKADGGQLFAIDKTIDLAEGKTKEQYIQEAYNLAKPQIDAWLDDVSVEGTEIDNSGNIISNQNQTETTEDGSANIN